MQHDLRGSPGEVQHDVTVGDFYLLLGNTPTDRTEEATACRLALVLPGLTTRGRPTGG